MVAEHTELAAAAQLTSEGIRKPFRHESWKRVLMFSEVTSCLPGEPLNELHSLHSLQISLHAVIVWHLALR